MAEVEAPALVQRAPAHGQSGAGVHALAQVGVAAGRAQGAAVGQSQVQAATAEIIVVRAVAVGLETARVQPHLFHPRPAQAAGKRGIEMGDAGIARQARDARRAVAAPPGVLHHGQRRILLLVQGFHVAAQAAAQPVVAGGFAAGAGQCAVVARLCLRRQQQAVFGHRAGVHVQRLHGIVGTQQACGVAPCLRVGFGLVGKYAAQQCQGVGVLAQPGAYCGQLPALAEVERRRLQWRVGQLRTCGRAVAAVDQHLQAA